MGEQTEGGALKLYLPRTYRGIALLGLLTSVSCTKAPETNAINVAETKSFRLTHNLELTDTSEERIVAGGKNAAAIDALFKRKFEYDFNFVDTGQTSPISELIIYSVVPDEVSITSVTLVGPNAKDFVIVETPDLPASLPKNGDYKVKLVFSPRSTGQKKATLLIGSASHGAFRGELTGNGGGSPEIKLTLISGDSETQIPNKFIPRPLAALPPLAPGQCEELPQFHYKIANDSNLPLTVTSANVTGPNAELFKLRGVTFPLIVPTKKSADFFVDFSGGQPMGNYSAELAIESNDLNESLYQVALATYTRGPSPCLQAAITVRPGEPLVFQPVHKQPKRALGLVPTESTVLVSLHLKNSGFAPLVFAPEKLSYAVRQNPPPVSMRVDFPTTGINLAPGESATIPVTFTTLDQRVPFSGDIRFALGGPTDGILATTIEGVVGNSVLTRAKELSVQEGSPRPQEVIPRKQEVMPRRQEASQKK